MKTLSIITVAIFLGFSGAAMASDSGENRQDDTNTTGPNPYMTLRSPIHHDGANAFAQKQPARHHVVISHVKK